MKITAERLKQHNARVLNETTVQSDDIIEKLALFEKRINGTSDNYSSTNRRLYRLANHVIDNSQDSDYHLDNSEVKFSQLYASGINSYLYVLNLKFIEQLRQNKLHRGFALSLSQPSLYTLHGFSQFLAEQLEKDKNAIFCCHTVELRLNLSGQYTQVYINELAGLIGLLDSSRLKVLQITLNQLNQDHLQTLAQTLQDVSNTVVRFKGLDFHQSLALEAINDRNLQPKVAYTPINKGNDKTNQQVLTLESFKLNVLMERTVHLQPLKGKVGLQNQQQYQQQTQQKQEVKILQSWQIEQQKKEESSARYDFLFGEEERNLVSWPLIEAAFDPQNADYTRSRNKLGDELVNYHYKGRNLIDLWQRLTGNIEFTRQRKNDQASKKSKWYGIRDISNTISHQTLLTIARHPHLFQDGVHLKSLTDSFAFDRNRRALFTRNDLYESKKTKGKSTPFTIKLDRMATAGLPSAEHFNVLNNSGIASQLFFQNLCTLMHPHEAWHFWRQGFVALNGFGHLGIKTINVLINQSTYGLEPPMMVNFLHYFTQALNYYHWNKITRQQAVLANEIHSFEHTENASQRQGGLFNLSLRLINSLPKALRDQCHDDLIDVFNKPVLQMSAECIDSIKQTLSTVLAVHQQQLAAQISKPFFNKEMIEELLTVAGAYVGMKLLELAVSNDSSVVYVLFSQLRQIHQKWGVAGLTDFNDSFMMPAINLAPLAEPLQQQACHHLLQLSQQEYHWWQQLTRQHTQQSGYADFATLSNAFQYFLSEFATLFPDTFLPVPCPIQNIKNLQVSLNRVMCVLQQADKPVEQLQYLANLDWAADGVMLACDTEDYRFVHADMQLNVEYELAYDAFDKQVGHGYYHPFVHQSVKPFHIFYVSLDKWEDKDVRQQLLRFCMASFFRFIGAKKFAAPLSVYQELLAVASDKLKEYPLVDDVMVNDKRPKNDSYDVVLCELMPVIAYATTGCRGLDQLPQQSTRRVQQLRQWMTVLFECASENTSDKRMSFKSREVVYPKLMMILGKCAEFYSEGSRVSSEGKDQHLDLDELTLILKLVRQSQVAVDNARRGIDKKEIFNILFVKGDTTKSPFEKDIIDRTDNQLLFLGILFKEYQMPFFRSLVLLSKTNQRTDLASFLLTTLFINEKPFSFDNKRLLIRLLSVVNSELAQLSSQASYLQQFVTLLQRYQQKAGTDALNELLAVLSRLVPMKQATLTFEQLQRFTESFVMRPGLISIDELTVLIAKEFKDYRLNPYDDELHDQQFYQSPRQLELDYPGLGRFYTSIKSLLLQQYLVPYGNNCKVAWQEFLSRLLSLTSEQQDRVIDTLLNSVITDLDLITLNAWLVVLLKPQDNEVNFHPDTFNLLTPALLNHSCKDDFIKQLESWFDHKVDFPLHNNGGFISFLSQLAEIEGGKACLHDGYQLALAMAGSHDKPYPWHKHLIALLNQCQQQQVPVVVLPQFMNRVSEAFHFAASSKEHSTQYYDALWLWLTNIEQTFNLTFSMVFQEQPIKEVFNKILILAHTPDSLLNDVYQSLNRMSAEQLQQLAVNYQLKPVPDAQLLIKLLSGDLTLAQFETKHTSDPHNDRSHSVVEQQFNNDVLWPYRDKAKLLQPEPVALPFNEQLYSELKFINHLGLEEIRFLSLNGIRKQLHFCRDWLRKAVSQDEKRAVYLTVVALVREAVYKTSQSSATLWPSAVQMLALLSAINHRVSTKEKPNPLFMKMATGEGKSLLAVFLAILSWVDGKPTVVVAHHGSLALRDAQSYSSLFESLSISSMHLTADNYRKNAEIAFDGIYYSDFNDIALIRQQHLLDLGIDINSMSFIIDEGDKSILHNPTDNNLSQLNSGKDEHADGWVFEALAAYLDNKSSPELTVNVSELIDFLCRVNPSAASVCQQVEFLVKLPDYLQAAWQAKSLNQGSDDYIARVEHSANSQKAYAAVLLNDNPMPSNVTFNGMTHQALHGLLNFKAKKQSELPRFAIAAESKLFSTMSPTAVLQWMMRSGEVIAMSATIESAAELMEMKQAYGFDFIKLPKMHNSLRVDYPELFCVNQAAQFELIKKLCKHYTTDKTQNKSRTIIIDVENIEMAQKVSYFLKPFNLFVLHGGIEELNDALLSKLEHQAGESDHILIAVGGLIARGFNARLTSAKQVVVITTYLKSKVSEIQVKGRSGRINQITGLRDKGKFHAIYDGHKEVNRYQASKLSIRDIQLNPEAFKQKQYFAHYQLESALRIQRQLISISKDCIQEHFYSLWKTLFNEKKVASAVREQVLTIYINALEKMINLYPDDNFSDNSSQAIKTRLEFNHLLLDIYQQALTEMQEIVGHKGIYQLFDEISTKQYQLCDNHSKALATGPDKPAFQCYSRWKKGLAFNQYLDSGKQGLGNYLYGVVNTWSLSAENQAQMQQAKKALERKMQQKFLKLSDFMMHIKQVMNQSQCEDLLFIQFLQIYNDNVNPKTPTHVPLEHPVEQVVSDVSCVSRYFDKQQYIQFIHDPLSGKGCQITLVSSNVASFARLQWIASQVYQIDEIKTPIDFKFTLVDKEPGLYQLKLDFSAAGFNGVDRVQLMTDIGNFFAVDVKSLVKTPAIPSLKAMKNIMHELQNLSPELMRKLFNNINEPLSRASYYDQVFKPTIKQLKGHKLPLAIRLIIEALADYNEEIAYHDNSKKSCIAYPLAFENAAELIENHKKRKAINEIKKKITVLANDTLGDSLLCRQQAELFRSLRLSIIVSAASESLQSIYTDWLKQKVRLSKQELTVEELMKSRKEQPLLFIKDKSPDAMKICQHIEVIINPVELLAMKP